MKKQLTVKKDNALINASYTLTTSEKRLILLAAAEARGNIEELKGLRLHASIYADTFKVEMQTAYEVLQEAAETLFERRVTYYEGKKKTVTRWVSHITYAAGEGYIEIGFAPKVQPLLCEIETRFTAYDLKAIAPLTSIYAIRLYELIIAWRSTFKTPVIEVIDLRKKLGVEKNEYARMTDFKRRVLDFAIKQINQHTDITSSYEQKKRGRKITGFSFTFKQKNAVKTLSKKPKREQITKKEAEKKAHIGESWPDLLKRLAPDFHIIDL